MFVVFPGKRVHSFINISGHPVALSSLGTIDIGSPYNFSMSVTLKKKDIFKVIIALVYMCLGLLIPFILAILVLSNSCCLKKYGLK